MTARQITDAILEIAEAYHKLGSKKCETPSEYATRRLNERKSGESKKSKLLADVIAFIGLVLDGFIRHFDVSVALFEAFCEGLHKNKEDRYGMSFMAYLVLFRYNSIDFGADTIAPLIFHVSPRNRILDFVNFMCDEEMLATHAAAKWTRHVQDAYVEDFLIPTCLENAAAIRSSIYANSETITSKKEGTNTQVLTASELLPHDEGDSDFSGDDGDGPYAARRSSPLILSSPATSKSQNDDLTARLTSPRPPRSSRGPKLPPAGVREMQYTLPEPKPKPIGASYQATEAELRVVEASKHGVKLSALDDATRAENRVREEAIPFRPFNVTERPSNVARLQEEKRARERAEMASLPRRPSVGEVRRNLKEVSSTVEVKTTKAALKRELALVNKKRGEEEAKFANRLAALRDDTEFREWQAQGRQTDEEEKLRLMQQRRLDAMLADEEARQTKVKQTRLKLAESRVMKDEIGEQRERLRREQEAKQAELARQAEEQRQQISSQVADAVESVQKAKKATVEEIKIERQKNEVEMALMSEMEHRRKAEMIQRIKKMREESAEMRKELLLARQAASKASNYSSVTDDGLSLLHVPMEEMSLVDLKKLLNATMREQERLVEEKRQRINAERAAEKTALSQMEALVMQHRDEIRVEKESKREDRRVRLGNAAAITKAKEEQQILDLQAKLAKRREERKANELTVRDEEKKRSVAAQLLMRDSKAVEKKKIEQMERAAENTVINAQNARLRERRTMRTISANEAGQREENLNSAQRKLHEARALSDAINSEKRATQKQEDSFDLLVRKALYAEMGASSARR